MCWPTYSAPSTRQNHRLVPSLVFRLPPGPENLHKAAPGLCTKISTRRRDRVPCGQKTLPQTPSPMPEPSPLLPCLCLFYFSTVLSPKNTIQTCMNTRPTNHTLSRHKYSTYNPVRCTIRFPNLTRSMLSQNIRTATPLLKKLPPCVPLSRPLYLCSKKLNPFAFPFHKYSTYSPVRCTDRLPHPTRSML